MNQISFEIERKYLIKKPDEKFLCSVCSKKLRISQTYLVPDVRGMSQRIRRIDDGQAVYYVMTEKKSISAIRRIEIERQIDLKEYNQLLRHKKAPATSTIEKTRYVIPNGSPSFEIDLFDGWEKLALMEIELESENMQFDFCPFMKFVKNATAETPVVILKEVTEDRRFRNYSMAKEMPNELEEIEKSGFFKIKP